MCYAHYFSGCCFRLECQILADLKPESIHWQVNGQELLQSERVEIGYVEDVGAAHLTVHQVGPSDSGEYTCVVVGEVTEPTTGERKPKSISSTAQVTITGNFVPAWCHVDDGVWLVFSVVNDGKVNIVAA